MSNVTPVTRRTGTAWDKNRGTTHNKYTIIKQFAHSHTIQIQIKMQTTQPLMDT